LFINIDYNKRKIEAKFELAKPNKRVISNIWEKFNHSINAKLGNVNELTFSIPYYIEDSNGEMIENPHVTSIMEKMYIRATLGVYKEWYIVDSIEEDADDTNVFNVTAYSIPYELKGKRVSGYTEDSINATNLLTNLLKPTIWKIGTVDAMFDVMFRSFDSGDDSNVLDCIIKAGETYGALIVWDTISRTISFKDATKNGKFRGMTVNYGKFLNSIKRTRTTDEMVTRLYVYGSDDLNIAGVNPTGQIYIENFGYFMYPFERDANKNVITSSYFMSDELCNALLDHQALVQQNGSQVLSLQSQILDYNTQMVTEQSKLDGLNAELTTIQGLLDTANSTGNQALITQRTQERTNKESDILQQQSVIDTLNGELLDAQSQLNNIQNQISMETVFTDELLDELNLYIIESVWKDENYIDAQDLYEDSLVKFEEIRQPKVVIDVTIDNLLNIIEEQYYWDKIVLGDLIKVKYPMMNIEYMAKIIQINYDLENSEISLTIANTTDLLSDTEKLTQLIYSSASATSVVENNKYKWNKVAYVQEQVSQLVSSEWDATKNKIIAGVNNSVEVGNRGIIIKNPDYPDEIVIMQSGVIALSKDAGETWKTAIKPDGVVAERLIGRVIAGENLLITNSTGSFTFDNNGAVFDVGSFIVRSSSGSNLVDDWQNATDFINDYANDNMLTSLEKSNVKDEWGTIATEYTSKISTVDTYYGSEQSNYSFITDYKNAYQALYNYLNTTQQSDGYAILATNNMSNTSAIDGQTYKTKFNNYYNARTELDNQLVTKAFDTAKSAQDRIDEVSNDVVYKTELHSTNGQIFNNGHISTTLYVMVYRGVENITDTLPNSAFVWRKTNDDGTEDLLWKNAHANVGKSITVTKSDVFKRATFWCDINL
jgi:phage minor structural protein